MSEKAERVVARAREMVLTYRDDPVEFQRQFREMLVEEFPVKAPAFTDNESMPLHGFLRRLEQMHGGVIPATYQRDVWVLESTGRRLLVSIDVGGDVPNKSDVPKVPAVPVVPNVSDDWNGAEGGGTIGTVGTPERSL